MRNIRMSANSAPVIGTSRGVAHVPQMEGWKITPARFANQAPADIELDR